MEVHIEDLGTRDVSVNGLPANMRLDLRVQPGGMESARRLELFGRGHDVLVNILEFP